MLLEDEEKGTPRLELELPEVDAGGHLIGYLFEVGPFQGDGSITFQEIESWRRQTGHQLSGWETGALRSLSAAYASEYMAASEPLRAPPYRSAASLQREEVDKKLRAAFAMLEGG